MAEPSTSSLVSILPLRSSSPLSTHSSTSLQPSTKRPRRLSTTSLRSNSSASSSASVSFSSSSESDSESSTNVLDGYDPYNLPTAQCQWGDCREEFYELEVMIEHLHSVHAFPITNESIPAPTTTASGKKSSGPSYACDWLGCNRRGKAQTSKFALMSHLRSHTGEKPFDCPRAECDKSFTRTDALQKHMRIQHQEIILPSTRRMPNSKRSKARANSIDSQNDKDEMDATNIQEDDQTLVEGETIWSEEELNLFELHPTLNKYFIAYVVLKAKFCYGLGEHEDLLSELEVLGIREAELGSECEELLRRILRKEIPVDKSEDPNLPSTLETFLTNYSNSQVVTPEGWSAGRN